MKSSRTSTVTLTLSSAAVSVALLLGSGLLPASAAPTAVGLGTADPFAVLAGAGITNTGLTTVKGDVGTFPTMTETGTATLSVTGVNHGGDAVTQSAKTDLGTAYNAAAAAGPPTPITSDLGGQTLTAGVYNSASSIGLTGALTLDGGGNSAAVFVFQAGSTLTTAAASSVVLINGAQACNVFWQVGSSATLGTASTFRGSILALTDITVTSDVQVDGRVLARNGAVTLDTDTISRPSCAAPAPPPAPSMTPTPSPTMTPTATPAPTATATVTPAPTATPTSPPAPTPSVSAPAPTPSASGPAPKPTHPAPAPSPTKAPAPGPRPGTSKPGTGTPGGAGNTPGQPLVPISLGTPGGNAPTPNGSVPSSGLRGNVPQSAGPQVRVVPRGGVHAGDGSAAVRTGAGEFAGVWLVLGLSCVGVGLLRRRRAS